MTRGNGRITSGGGGGGGGKECVDEESLVSVWFEAGIFMMCGAVVLEEDEEGEVEP